ncbi:uncharacterized protein LOC129725062 [Wyeomyia smithii]|uniref:uncharacterized protein LOC129725062 n=1 Tax=Wyeomyia smithii TaxID=174621 RepID=UPI002467F608|nr:uncharacterized protein LOC129725062 [Wyeomyia smithii]
MSSTYLNVEFLNDSDDSAGPEGSENKQTEYAEACPGSFKAFSNVSDPLCSLLANPLELESSRFDLNQNQIDMDLGMNKMIPDASALNNTPDDESFVADLTESVFWFKADFCRKFFRSQFTPETDHFRRCRRKFGGKCSPLHLEHGKTSDQ